MQPLSERLRKARFSSLRFAVIRWYAFEKVVSDKIGMRPAIETTRSPFVKNVRRQQNCMGCPSVKRKNCHYLPGSAGSMTE